MSNDYGMRQKEKDRAYRDAWKTPEVQQWIDSLPAEERRRLAAEGLLAPLLPKDGTANGCGIEDDAAVSSDASIDAPSVLTNDSLESILADYPQIGQAIEARAQEIAGSAHGTEMLRRLSLLFIDQGRRALNADCLAFVSGLAVRMGESGTSLAARHGISRQAFHKRCNDLLKELGLPPSRAMKSQKARSSYRETNRRWTGGRSVNGTSSPH